MRCTYRAVLLLSHDVAAAVGAGLRMQQLPELGAHGFEVRVHEHLAVVRLAHNEVHEEGCSEGTQVSRGSGSTYGQRFPSWRRGHCTCPFLFQISQSKSR